MRPIVHTAPSPDEERCILVFGHLASCLSLTLPAASFLHVVQVEGLNVPMSVGPPSVDTDNAGAECVLYDVVVNPNVSSQFRRQRQF